VRSSASTATDPFGPPLGPRSSIDSIYGRELDDGEPEWWERRSVSSRPGSSVSSGPGSYTRPSWLDDETFASAPGGRRVGGWKSPRKRKPRGTKKYHSKV
jgi:hypothetical protein